MGCTQTPPCYYHHTMPSRIMNGRRGIDKSERIHTATERARLSLKRNNIIKGAAQDNNNAPLPPMPKLNSEGQLIAEEVAKRISGSVETKDVILGDTKSGLDEDLIHVRYAALTQRGYYPDKPHKENQDAYYICPSKFASGEGDAFFAVFDGHGDAGHDCANFAKQKLQVHLAQQIKKARAAANATKLKELERAGMEKPKNAFHPGNWPYLNVEEYEKCVRNAHLSCNRAMHDDKLVKDSMSGTTAISVGFHAGRMTVSNVGDSRVVLGYRLPQKDNENESGGTPAEEEKKEIGEESDAEPDNIGTVDSTNPDDYEQAKNNNSNSARKLLAIPLSEDQTPYRRDERDRLKKAGARICSIDQMEGIVPMHDDWGEGLDLGIDIDTEGDPPRVWCQDHDYPGTAFSRSLGDSVGEDIGVNAEPEIVTKDVTMGDEILVIASDGIFEFLTNQRVIDICAGCNDPLHACTRLLEESYKQWLHYELRTDDITCIVMFLKNVRADNEEVMQKLMNKKHSIKDATKGKVQRGDSMPGKMDDVTT